VSSLFGAEKPFLLFRYHKILDMRIDAHHHFWRYSADEYGWIDESKKSLQRDFLPTDLKVELTASGIDGVVSVQARQTSEETRALLGYAAVNRWIRGVVGWVPLGDEMLADVLEGLCANRLLRGVRHVVQDEPDDRFMLQPNFVRGISQLAHYNLVYDLLVLPQQLAAAIELVDQFPNQVFVLDHIAKPKIELGSIDTAWRSPFMELAKRENVYCKFSGVITEVRDERWGIETIKPYWDIALEAYGSKRLMFGTDWPVCLLRGSYSQWTEVIAELSSKLSPAELASVWGETAIKAYSLD